MNTRCLCLALVAFLTSCQSLDPAAPYTCGPPARQAQCVTVIMASRSDDALAKQFAPAPHDKARLYIVRPYTIEPTIKTEVAMDGNAVAELAPRTYLMFDIDPGEHRLQMRTNALANATMQFSAGQTYFIAHDLTQFFNTVVGRIKVLDPGSGQRLVRSSQRVAMPNVPVSLTASPEEAFHANTR